MKNYIFALLRCYSALIVIYGYFGTTYHSHLQGSSNPSTAWLRANPEDRSHSQRGKSLKITQNKTPFPYIADIYFSKSDYKMSVSAGCVSFLYSILYNALHDKPHTHATSNFFVPQAHCQTRSSEVYEPRCGHPWQIINTQYTAYAWVCVRLKRVPMTKNFTIQPTLVKPIYTECPRRNGQNFGRVFLMLDYTDITQNTYIQSWTVTEIKAIEKCGLLGCPRTVSRPWRHTHHCACPATRNH